MPAEGQVFSGAPPQGELLQRVRGGAGDSILPLMGHPGLCGGDGVGGKLSCSGETIPPAPSNSGDAESLYLQLGHLNHSLLFSFNL